MPSLGEARGAAVARARPGGPLSRHTEDGARWIVARGARLGGIADPEAPQDRDSGARQAIRFRHIEGITKRMEVEWSFSPVTEGTRVTVVHLWNGPSWPIIGSLAARAVIGPVFVHGIASRTLDGLARAAERHHT